MAKYRKCQVVEAEQFDPQRHPWPTSVSRWSKDAQPRDMSWGYVVTEAGKAHVKAGDWIITTELGEHIVLCPAAFEQLYELVPVANVTTDPDALTALGKACDCLAAAADKVKAMAQVLPRTIVVEIVKQRMAETPTPPKRPPDPPRNPRLMQSATIL